MPESTFNAVVLTSTSRYPAVHYRLFSKQVLYILFSQRKVALIIGEITTILIIKTFIKQLSIKYDIHVK